MLPFWPKTKLLLLLRPPVSSRFFPACTLAAAIKVGEPRKDWLAMKNRVTALCEQGLTFGACQEL